MKRAIFIFLVTAAAMIFFGCSENNSTAPELSQSDQVTNFLAKKPSANLSGPMVLTFTEANAPYVWDGTVAFEDEVVGITFQSLSKTDLGQTSHFVEKFYIYKLGEPSNVYMQGSDAGTICIANLRGGSLNGVVEEVKAPYEEWLGRRFHLKAEIVILPEGVEAHGTVRIN